MTSPAEDPIARRQRWLATLAHAPRAELAACAAAVAASHPFEWLRQPETGLAMVQARIANEGDRYNVGEVTLTRCVVRITYEGHSTAGVGHALGRDDERALWVAQLDGLLQHPALYPRLLQSVIEPLRLAREALVAAEASRHAPSRVAFYTLQPESNA